MHLNKPYDEIWCVFDRDPATSNKTGHTAQNFNKAIQLAKKEKIEVAYSNQAFEYWLILHFLDHQGGKFPRTEYNTKLNKSLKPFNCKYDGNSSKIVTTELFDVLESKEPKTNKIHRDLAIIRAEKIYNRLDHSNPANEESSTTIFKLVKRLLKDYP
ncbi:RloB family protein [Arachidicoccus ginsenosidivorans]|uniref:RloB family protein n=1 Tax=Arachidicoccus ginsenosidivorans TaxID=496057 RepID=UPI001CEFACB8